MIKKSVLLVAVLVSSLLLGVAEIAFAQSQPQVIADSQLKALSTTIGGAQPLATSRTVPHWFGSTLDPHNGYQQLPSNPAPKCLARRHNQRATKPRHAAPEWPWCHLCRYRYRLVGGADQQPRESGEPKPSANLPDE